MEDANMLCFAQGCLHIILLWERKFSLWFTRPYCSLMGSTGWKITGKTNDVVYNYVTWIKLHILLHYLIMPTKQTTVQLRKAILDLSSYYLFPVKIPWITWNQTCNIVATESLKPLLPTNFLWLMGWWMVGSGHPCKIRE